MEKFYVIKPECGFYKQVFDYLENAQIVNKLFNQFSHDMEIESNLYIMPVMTRCQLYRQQKTKRNLQINSKNMLTAQPV